PHEVIIAGPDNAITARELNEALLQLLAGEEVDGGPGPIIFVPPVGQGEQLWLTLDLEPGTYIVVCSFPDVTGSGHVHAELGMRQTFIVTE
ncbi:MAG: hypothetical protein L0154_20420, partial [Chloroflexi bacterium]|nr:hypothetical protein [Chloroflexota bacterium]